ncbi:potassium transporter KtrB [Deinococcus metallilatus]|uniref:Potassium transporter KtrB n=1 Tax=Deinococcus metallilatus TaxID=1211322 RepID=A0AAJ5F2D3_9DEIO|nr:TrkH family potassium uptake protein [Deinococcus metallilatus]MBB5296010.1 trk system potassium uptake protein TrkH [Deinococcus metallilatus]QBY08170.1 potassium transporter KtrB [Deinococcus metallilatus]RXJ11902.1 potassium transporter KtrB [Deinococcus metallilatus]TLK25866.1 potassium transporter KtrB [Deinococcus metallilatus]GMA14455.1 potassium transporter KtrB [Deinococcus metallilatus]
MSRPPTPPASGARSADAATPRVRKPLFSRISPPQLIALSFALAILTGGVLLSLPFTHGAGRQVNFLQALFTATSALCVTGLNVVDPSRDFNRLGQVIIMLLIQMGGLGIITFGTVFALITRRRVNYSDRIRLAQQVSAFSAGDVVPLIRNIFLYTFVLELAGAALLAFRFVPLEGWGRGLFYAVFHSISAFNNSGFALYSDNLMGFVNDPLVSLVIALLIILGGMGFLVQLNVVAHLLNPRRNRLLVHSKLVLTMMAALLLIGTVTYLGLEWNNPRTLAPLPFGDKLLASFFQSVTTRTAGFNTIDYGAIRLGTAFITIILMFIGANPGSTGGGIKTSTFYVMMASAWSMVRGHRDTTLFERRIDQDTVLRAMTVGLLSIGLVNTMFILLLLMNSNPNILFVQLFFEAVSAFGTVGLSMNTTPLLNADQQIVIILLMYLGRIGPLTFAVAFNNREPGDPVRYPAEKDIIIG